MRVFVTMITPRVGGAGDYLDLILKKYDRYIKFYPLNFNIRNIYIRKIVSESQILLLKLFLLILIKFKIKELVIYHPQTIGYNISNKLIYSSNKIIYYILDASIFCIRSYNHRNFRECEKCIQKIDPYDDCTFFPGKNNYSDFLKHHYLIKKKLNNINFITQTDGYNEILKKIFGQKVLFSLEKMKYNRLNTLTPKLAKKKYDFLLHGNYLPAKGSEYVISLSKKMTDRVFFIPANGKSRYNLIFKKLNWETGLKDAISSTKIVLCPSFWSAPLEASILKTMLLKVPVALYLNQYSASSKLIPKDCFINLCGDIDKDIKVLDKYIKNDYLLDSMKLKAYDWSKNYLSE